MATQFKFSIDEDGNEDRGSPPQPHRADSFAFHKPTPRGRKSSQSIPRPAFYDIDTKQPLPVRHGQSRKSFPVLISEKELSDRSLPCAPSFSTLSSSPGNLPKKQFDWAFWWTLAVAVIPVLAFTVTLVVLVLLRRVRAEPIGTDVFVNLSSTKLVFIASWSSTVAPMLLGSLMTLWHLPTARKRAETSSEGVVERLPTPQQLSFLIGLSAGSFDELRKYLLYKLRRFRAEMSPLLTRSAIIMFVSTVLAAMIFLADTAIHAFTNTVPVSVTANIGNSRHFFAREMIERCGHFNRAANQGLPCTVVADASVGANAVAYNPSEIIALESNSSKTSTGWNLDDPSLNHGDLVVLMPQTTSVPANLEFAATTIDVSTQCASSTHACNLRMSENTTTSDSYVIFNCTGNFRGVLGAQASVSNESLTWTRTDSTTPDFNMKIDRNFQYAYFTDPALTKPYNSIGGVPGGSASWVDSSAQHALSDSKLLNEYYLATAGLVPIASDPSGQALLSDPAMFQVSSNLAAYTLNCTVTGYSVTYTISNSTVTSFAFTPFPNGSILEFAHGMQAMGMPSLSQAQSTASLSTSSAAFARTYANLHSWDALTLIGSVTRPRLNVGEFITRTLLVTKIPTLALAYMLSANLLFFLFASVLAFRAFICCSPDTRDMIAKLSVEGLAATAFEDGSGKQELGAVVSGTDDMFEESRIGQASRRVSLRKTLGGSWCLRIEQPHL